MRLCCKWVANLIPTSDGAGNCMHDACCASCGTAKASQILLSWEKDGGFQAAAAAPARNAKAHQRVQVGQVATFRWQDALEQEGRHVAVPVAVLASCILAGSVTDLVAMRRVTLVVNLSPNMMEVTLRRKVNKRIVSSGDTVHWCGSQSILEGVGKDPVTHSGLTKGVGLRQVVTRAAEIEQRQCGKSTAEAVPGQLQGG